MQNASGGFDLAWQLTTAVNDTAVADLDGDGKAEIIHLRSVQTTGADNIGIFIYSYDGQLKRRIPLQGGWLTPLTIADVDGDGRSDIVVGADGTLYAFRDDGRPIWAYAVPADVPSDPILAPFYTQPVEGSRVANAAPQVYDLDGDGVAEVVFTAYGRIIILDGRTGLRKLDPFWTYSHSNNDVSALMLIDMNNDGHVDIVQNAPFQFNCGFVGADFATECAHLVGPVVLSGGGANNWLPGPKAFPNVQYRSTAIDSNARVLHDTKVSRVFRVPEQQGTVRDPRLAQATSFTYGASNGAATSAPATVYLDIVPDNEPPVFTSTPPKSLLQRFAPTPPGGLVTNYYDLAAFDPDPGDTITFSLKSAPFWVTMSGPARIRFEPTCGSYGYPCEWGWATVIVSATDSRGASTDQIFIVNLTTTSVTVPNVVGMLFEAAKTALVAQDLQGALWVEIFGAQPAGTVLAQDAVAGAVVGRFDDIRLTVSKGPQPVLVPSVVGRTESAATSALTSAGFTIGVTRQFSSTVARGIVISQTPAGNTELPPGAAQIVVSSGNGLALTLSSGLMPANQTLTARPAAFYVDGNPLAAPAVTYVITPRQTPYAGTLPTIAGTTISAGVATLGSFTLTATDTGNGRTASADFAVVMPTDVDGESSGASFAKLIGVMQGLDDFAPQLRAARAANDVPLMKSLLTQMVILWRTIDLDEMRNSMVISPPLGFVPSLKDMNGFGLSPTADDLLIKQVMRDAVNDLDAWTTEIRGTTTLATLNSLGDKFSTRAARIDALTVSEYGAILSLGEYQLLMGHRIPAFYEALMEEMAELVGIPRRAPAFPYRSLATVPAGDNAQRGLAAVLGARTPPRPGRTVNSTLAELAVTEAVGFITDKIMEEGLQSFKNGKQYAVDVMKQAAWGTCAIVLSNHIRQFAYGSQIYEVVSGASLSFRYFTIPYAFIEVPSNDEPTLNDVMIIGPDITSYAAAAVSGLIGDLKEGFSLGKDAATNPKHFKNHDAAQKLKKKLDAKVKDIQKGAQSLFDVTASMHQAVEDVEKGCIFDSDPNCVQLLFDSGIKSVYTYSPPPGFKCFSGLPLPIPFIVQDEMTGIMYFGTPAFLPTPKPPPPGEPPPPGDCSAQ
jgi:beta-lactam-binding protein with PASTA domain